ncbi:MAG: PEP-CTERM sorting domain-containing protein [Candidatus Didemnitutus sp.]|nr:PEP-CTERM sorting domain-containing protein [Candidatus Didemnitutus sp.]
MTSGSTRIVLALALILGVSPLSASSQVVLHFDDLSFLNYDPLPATYGDGLDPQVPDVQYRTFHADGVTVFEEHLELWHLDYGGLSNVVFASANGTIAEIMLIPEIGFGVRLVSFAMAGYSQVDRANTLMRILDAEGNVVFDFAANGPVPILGANGASSVFTPNIALGGPLRLQWGTDWNVGLDNLVFEGLPLASVPEPSTNFLLLLGLLALGAGRWCRRNRT